MCTLAQVTEIFLDGQPHTHKKTGILRHKDFSDEITQSDGIMSTRNIPDDQIIL